MSKRFNINFYGGWFVWDSVNRKHGDVHYNEAVSCETRDQAVELAALHNESGERLPVTLRQST